MTDIIVGPRVEDPLSDTESVASSGYVRVRPTAAYAIGGQWVQDVWSAPIPLAGSPLTFKLDALTDIPYELHVHIPDGMGGDYDRHEFRIVPASGVALKWEDLTQVGGPGAPVAIPGDLAARVTALEVAFPLISGGASTLASITNMSATARTFNAQTSYGTMRSTLGAVADVDVVHDTGNETVDGVKTFTSSPVVPTPTVAGQASPKSYVDGAVSGVVAGSVAWGNITGKPVTFPPESKIGAVTVTGTPTAGQSPVASSGSAAAWATNTATVGSISDVPGLTAALTAKRDAAVYETGELVIVAKDTVSGYWPASWTGKTPVYTGGSTSAGVRPTSAAGVVCAWKGADPSPAIVGSGTAGMRDNIDVRWVH